MAFCEKCGAQIDETTNICTSCGNVAGGDKFDQAVNSVTDKFNEFNNTSDTTAAFDQNDINQNKVMAILSYIGILVLIPIFAAKNSKFARFHANQGLLLCIIGIAMSIISMVLGEVPVIGFLLGIIGGLVSVVTFVLAIIGICNACTGKAKELPIVGKYRVLK